jgi:hypothetical protein
MGGKSGSLNQESPSAIKGSLRPNLGFGALSSRLNCNAIPASLSRGAAIACALGALDMSTLPVLMPMLKSKGFFRFGATVKYFAVSSLLISRV